MTETQRAIVKPIETPIQVNHSKHKTGALGLAAMALFGIGAFAMACTDEKESSKQFRDMSPREKQDLLNRELGEHSHYAVAPTTGNIYHVRMHSFDALHYLQFKTATWNNNSIFDTGYTNGISVFFKVGEPDVLIADSYGNQVQGQFNFNSLGFPWGDLLHTLKSHLFSSGHLSVTEDDLEFLARETMDELLGFLLSETNRRAPSNSVI